MKSDYSLRTIDNVGRIVIPMDLRRTLDIQDHGNVIQGHIPFCPKFF